MTDTDRADMAVMAQRTLNGFNDHDRATLARDAQHIADQAARYAKKIAEGGKDMGEANRIAQSASAWTRGSKRPVSWMRSRTTRRRSEP